MTVLPPVSPPNLDDVLRWLVELEESAADSNLLSDGGDLLDRAGTDFGAEHLETVARRLIDLGNEGLIRFDDPGVRLDQLSTTDRLGMAREFRATTHGRDRARQQAAPSVPHIVQIVNTTTAQVAAGDIPNIVSFAAFLDRAEEEIDGLEGVEEEARDEARSLVQRLRAATGQAATGAVGGAGGAVLGAVLKQLLGLP
jgi:hypothetical protein